MTHSILLRSLALGHYELILEGRIYADSAPKLKEAIVEQVDTMKYLLVNAESLEQIDSSGLNVFVHVLKQLRPRHGKILFYGLNPNLRRVFEITKLETVMGVYPDRESALESMGS